MLPAWNHLSLWMRSYRPSDCSIFDDHWLVAVQWELVLGVSPAELAFHSPLKFPVISESSDSKPCISVKKTLIAMWWTAREVLLPFHVAVFGKMAKAWSSASVLQQQVQFSVILNWCLLARLQVQKAVSFQLPAAKWPEAEVPQLQINGNKPLIARGVLVLVGLLKGKLGRNAEISLVVWLRSLLYKLTCALF